MGGDEPMEDFEGEITLAEFMADRADRLAEEYYRAGADATEHGRWYIRQLERQLITGGY